MGEAAATEGKHSKFKHEMIALWWAFLYLFLLFGMFILYRQIVLAEHGINEFKYGMAAINALIFAKVILIGNWINVGARSDAKPLIWSILAKSVSFAGLFIVFHFIEEAVVSLFHHKSIAESVDFGMAELHTAMIGGVIFAIALIPFFAIREVVRAIGDERFHTMLFSVGGVNAVFGKPQ